MIKTRTCRRVVATLAVGLLAAGVGACSSGGSKAGSSGGKATGAQLIIAGSSLNSISDTFSPYSPTSASLQTNSEGLIYEPLIQFNAVAPPANTPWLATGYTWSDGGKTITFTIRKGVKWSNGTPMTPADVAFTYNLMKTNPAMNVNGLKLNSVTTSGDTVTLTFPTPQYTNLETIAGQTYILPKSIWASQSSPQTFADPQPVGTGPYMLASFTGQGFELKKNPYYWQPVSVPSIFYPVYTSGPTAINALGSGQIDWSSQFIPNIEKEYTSKSPDNHYWMAPTGTNYLIPNLNTWPTNQLPVRQAISAALDRSLIASEGESGLETATSNASGLTLPTYQAWAGPVSNLTLSANPDPASAKQILQSAGYTLGSNGFFQKGGKTVSLTIIDPASFSDYALSDTLIATELKAAGIDATFQGISTQSWTTDIASGNFQLSLHWSLGTGNPYNLYYNWLDSALINGSNTAGDFERLNNPTIDSELTAVAATEGTTAQATALAPIEKYVAANLPVIPTTGSAGWFEYSTAKYTGWPTPSNPYDLGEPISPSLEVVILHLKPA
jgi:peptide/nickel transport system substrate-binding protein